MSKNKKETEPAPKADKIPRPSPVCSPDDKFCGYSGNFDKKDRAKLGAFQTLALAEQHKGDKDTRSFIPSEEAVEQARDWSIENKQ